MYFKKSTRKSQGRFRRSKLVSEGTWRTQERFKGFHRPSRKSDGISEAFRGVPKGFRKVPGFMGHFKKSQEVPRGVGTLQCISGSSTRVQDGLWGFYKRANNFLMVLKISRAIQGGPRGIQGEHHASSETFQATQAGFRKMPEGLRRIL